MPVVGIREEDAIDLESSRLVVERFGHGCLCHHKVLLRRAVCGSHGEFSVDFEVDLLVSRRYRFNALKDARLHRREGVDGTVLIVICAALTIVAKLNSA